MLNFGNKEFRNLQEQVLKNAQDIEVLKGRENLQIVIVEELPEVGNPNYIYLVPNEDGEEANVYNEYIWLADEETYEKIGGVSIDLTNYVTTDTEQTITAAKKFSGGILLSDDSDIVPVNDGQVKLGAADRRFSYIYASRLVNQYGALTLTGTGGISINLISADSSVKPTSNNSYNLGSNNARWKDLYLSGNIKFDTDIYFKNSSDATLFYIGSSGDTWIYGTLVPEGTSGTRDIGNSSHFWKDLYLTGNISDGVNSTTVANISTKTTSIYQSGTFDSNGESTINVSDGWDSGLFIFAYGNCQCVAYLTFDMIQSANLTPIRIACPMIYNSGTVNGWLRMTRNSGVLTITVTDGTNHVDSDYAWTLTKTNLL